jgi:hypothetical protein
MYSHLIGKSLAEVKKELINLKHNFTVKDNNSGSGIFDTELVVRIKQIDKNMLELTTSKFKLSI